jgi:uncharacterized RDD family membrane protein YckC
MTYIVFRDGLFPGQSIGRNVLFLVRYLLPLGPVISSLTVALFRSPERQRFGDRIAGTRVIRREAVPALA